MYKSVIAEYSRSPFTMARKGELIDIKPVNLLAEVIKDLIKKSKIETKDIEDVIVGCAFQVGEQCFNIGKGIEQVGQGPPSNKIPLIFCFTPLTLI